METSTKRLYPLWTSIQYRFLWNRLNRPRCWHSIFFIEKSIVKGRILYIQTKYIVTGNIFNIFSFYGKSNVNKVYAENLISKLDKEIQQNELENVIISGDFNFVTSTNDRNTNKFTQTDNLYIDKHGTPLRLKMT